VLRKNEEAVPAAQGIIVSAEHAQQPGRPYRCVTGDDLKWRAGDDDFDDDVDEVDPVTADTGVEEPDESESAIPTVPETRRSLDEISAGIEWQGGKPRKRNARLVEQDVWRVTLRHFQKRGEFLRIPQPRYLDHIEHRLIDCSADSAGLWRLLRGLGFVPRRGFGPMVVQALADYAMMSPIRQCQHLASMDTDAAYIRAGDSDMFRVTAESIDKVPIGENGVVLAAGDVASWPGLDELQPEFEALRPLIGDTCTGNRPDLPLCRHLTARWSEDGILNPEQASQMFISRLMFMFAASRYSLWPLLLHTGDQNSGKSTPFELFLSLLRNKPADGKMLPGTEGDLVASLTNSTIAVYDNVDGAGLEKPNRSFYSDYFCLASTGGDVDLRKLFHTNELVSFPLHCHEFFTVRVNPFGRSDVMRRTIVLEMAAPVQGTPVEKDHLKRQILSARTAILAEILLRVQNILRAHQAYGDKAYQYQSEMAEYEAFTLRCAEYEGSLPQTRMLWAAYMRQYRQSITASNPLVFAIRLWLGKGNANRQVSPTTLFAELQTIFEETGQKFIYKSPSGFGKQVASNLRALQTLGLELIPTRGNQEYVFRTPAVQLDLCRRVYNDLTTAARLRPDRPSARHAGFDLEAEDPTPDVIQ
jgi:hypothetical protein